MGIWLGKHYGIIAKVGGRRQSEGDRRSVSKLGGIGLFFGFILTTILAQYLPVPRFDPNETVRLTGLIIGGVLIFIVGIIDDFYELSAVQIGITQIFVAATAIAFQIIIEGFNNPFTGQQTSQWPDIFTVTLSMFWLGLMMNTTNMMDGVDGLAAGVALIAGAILFLNSAFILNPTQTSVSLLPLALMGSSLGFLLFNFYPARVFMGGSAYFLGYVLGALSIIGGAKMATILLVMGLPLMDLVWQASNRLLRGKNPMTGDRGHIHFRLQDVGFSQQQIALIYYAFCTCFGVLTLVTESRLFKLIAFLAMIGIILLGFYIVARQNYADSASVEG